MCVYVCMCVRVGCLCCIYWNIVHTHTHAYINTYMYVCLYVCMHACIYQAIYLSVCLSVSLSLCLSISLSLYLSVSLSIYLSVCLSIYLFLYLCIHVSMLHAGIILKKTTKFQHLPVVSTSRSQEKNGAACRYILSGMIAPRLPGIPNKPRHVEKPNEKPLPYSSSDVHICTHTHIYIYIHNDNTNNNNKDNI